MSRRGFTLVELMVTLAILAMAGTFIYTVFITQHDSYLAQQDVTESQQDVRVALDLLTRDLRSTGYGVAGGGTGIASTVDGTNGSPDSITFQVGQPQGTLPYLTVTPTSSTIDVNSTKAFAENNKVAIISAWSKLQLGPLYTVTTVSGTTQLVLDSTPPLTGNDAVHQGDLVVGSGSTGAYANTITYDLAPDEGSYLLRRTVNGTVENLADHIYNLQFRYTMDDGSVVDTVAAGNVNNVTMVQVTITSQTNRDVARMGHTGANLATGMARMRQLSTYVRMKNNT